MKSLYKINMRVLIITLLAIFSVINTAQAEDDKAVLSRLNFELSAMEQLIVSAERAPKAPGSRLTFSYGLLREDIKKIQAGIQEFLNFDADKPRTVPIKPLNGKYTK